MEAARAARAERTSETNAWCPEQEDNVMEPDGPYMIALGALRWIDPDPAYACPLFRGYFTPEWQLRPPTVEIILSGKKHQDGVPEDVLGTPYVIDPHQWEYLTHLRTVRMRDNSPLLIPCLVWPLTRRQAVEESRRRRVVSLGGSPRRPHHELAGCADQHGLRVTDLENGWALKSGSLARSSVRPRRDKSDESS
ncbi:MAG: hypothetical protein FKY71_04865 [Spiribacter salinus]|uniref:Uncharacterized protein n=1 Tax=Spiribacter salinus TaxID=1335746 RepID=A0A540VTV1_9GAMM|nr:MAG: hypothetical protein FKY71_04865 [Spiribacter salinus]